MLYIFFHYIQFAVIFLFTFAPLIKDKNWRNWRLKKIFDIFRASGDAFEAECESRLVAASSSCSLITGPTSTQTLFLWLCVCPQRGTRAWLKTSKSRFKEPTLWIDSVSTNWSPQPHMRSRLLVRRQHSPFSPMSSMDSEKRGERRKCWEEQKKEERNRTFLVEFWESADAEEAERHRTSDCIHRESCWCRSRVCKIHRPGVHFHHGLAVNTQRAVKNSASRKKKEHFAHLKDECTQRLVLEEKLFTRFPCERSRLSRRDKAKANPPPWKIRLCVGNKHS